MPGPGSPRAASPRDKAVRYVREVEKPGERPRRNWEIREERRQVRKREEMKGGPIRQWITSNVGDRPAVDYRVSDTRNYLGAGN